LDRLKDEISIAQSKSSSSENQFLLDLKKESIRMEATTKLQEAREAIFQVQAGYQTQLIQLHQAHGQESIRFAERYAAALEMELTRVVPEAVYLKRQAQFNARQREYGLAEQLFEQANATTRQHMMKIQERVQRSFEAKRAKIQSRQAQEIAICSEKRTRELELKKQKFADEIARYKASLTKTAIDLGITLKEADVAFLGQFTLDDVLTPISAKSRPASQLSPTISPASPSSPPVDSKELTP
jgi:hypothetical protein